MKSRRKAIVLGRLPKNGLYTRFGRQRTTVRRARRAMRRSGRNVAAGFEAATLMAKRRTESCFGTLVSIRVKDRGIPIRVEIETRAFVRPQTEADGRGCARVAEVRARTRTDATEKGWNLYVCGNGGMKPRHADLLASDLDEDTVIKYLDRFIMYYIATADRLTRTSVWLDKMEGGIDYLREVIIGDRLGICDELERQMSELVRTTAANGPT